MAITKRRMQGLNEMMGGKALAHCQHICTAGALHRVATLIILTTESPRLRDNRIGVVRKKTLEKDLVP